MENARVLEERLRKIIGEISGRTGNEIKKHLLDDFGNCLRTTLEIHAEKETIKFLSLFKKIVDTL